MYSPLKSSAYESKVGLLLYIPDTQQSKKNTHVQNAYVRRFLNAFKKKKNAHTSLYSSGKSFMSNSTPLANNTRT